MTWSERQAQAKKQAEEEEEKSRSAAFKAPAAPVSSAPSFGGIGKSAALGGAGVAAAVGALGVAAADADEEEEEAAFVRFPLIVVIACWLTSCFSPLHHRHRPRLPHLVPKRSLNQSQQPLRLHLPRHLPHRRHRQSLRYE